MEDYTVLQGVKAEFAAFLRERFSELECEYIVRVNGITNFSHFQYHSYKTFAVRDIERYTGANKLRVIEVFNRKIKALQNAGRIVFRENTPRELKKAANRKPKAPALTPQALRAATLVEAILY